MQNNHTAAPWKARLGLFIDVIKDDDSAFGICNIGSPSELKDANYPIKEAIANAKLIAAAPAMLEALIEAKRMYEEIEPTGGWQGVYDEIDNAIKQATK